MQNELSEWIQILSTIISASVSIVGATIAYMLYRLSTQQQEESWLRTFKESHEAFWNDSVMAEVRSWIICEPAYKKIEPALIKRRKIKVGELNADTLSKDEYEIIEKLDKFLNVLLRIEAVSSHLKFDSNQVFWKKLSADYWVQALLSDARPELQSYVTTFYSPIHERFLLSSPINQESS